MRIKERNKYLLFLIALMLASCSGAKPKEQQEENISFQGVPVQESTVEQQSIEMYGPPTSLAEDSASLSSGEAAASATEESVASKEPARLCLVLGPGMAKGIAHASVLEVIKKAELPVHCVVGTEMGAIVGALYAYSNGSTNNLQWQLFKLSKDIYFHFPMLSLRDPKSSGNKLNEFLRGIFRKQKIEQLPIKFATVTTNANNGNPIFLDQGDLVTALSATAAIPGVFEPWDWNGEPVVSGAVSSPAPVELAKRLGGNFIVYVDVATENNVVKVDRFQKAFTSIKNLIRMQKREASYVIQIHTGNLPYDDFSRQGEYLSAGTKSAELAMPALKAAWEKRVAEQN